MKNFMRCIIALIFCSIAVTVAARSVSSADKTELMKHYIAATRVGAEMVMGGIKPTAEMAVNCDSLRHYLYDDTVSVSIFYKVAGRLTAECYNIVAGTGKTDYHQITVALNSCRNVPAFYDIYFLQCAMALGEYRLGQKDYEQAEAAYLLAKKCAEGDKDGISMFLPVIHLQLCNITSQAGKYIDAVVWSDTYIKDLEAQNKEDSDEYYEFLNIMANNQKMAGLKHAADSTYNIVCDKLKSKGLCDTDMYIDALLSRAEISPSDDKYEELLALTDKDDYRSDEVLAYAASHYYDTRKFDRLASCIDRVLDIVEADGSKVAMLTSFISMLNAPVIKSDYASRFLKLLVKNIDLNDLSDRALLASAYVNCGEYAKAAKEAAKVKKMADALLLEDNSDVISDKINNVVSMFVALYDFDNAIYYTEQAMPHYEQAYGRIMPSYIIEQKELLASYYNLNGDFHTSRKILTELLDNHDLSLEQFYSIGMRLADVTFGIGNFETLDKYCDEMLKENLTEERRWNFMNLKTTALISWIDVAYDRKSEEYMNKLSELEKCIEENKRFIAENFPDDVERKIECVFNSASFYFFTNNVEEMKRSADEIENLTREFINNKELKETYLGALAMFYIKSGDCSKALKLTDRKSGKFGFEKISDLQIQSEAYLAMGKKDKAQRAYAEMSNLIMAMTQQNFSMLTEQEKMKNWRKYEQQIADVGRFAVENDAKSVFGGVVYNLALYSKGLLLNSSKTFADMMENNSNPEVKEMYTLLKNKRKQLADNSVISADERRQIAADATEIERMLMDMVPESREYMKDFKYDWIDLKNRLGDNDVAIEFLEFQDIGYERNYAAAVVSKKLNNPVILYLGNVNETDSAVRSTFKADVVWKKLMPYLSADGRNYFSAVGKLHCLPIESLLTADGAPLSSVYPMYRLSSTRELLKDEYKSGDGMVMFGGIDYGKSVSGASRHVHRGVAYSLPYLPGTLREIEAVASLIEHDKLAPVPELYKGADGSEGNFKQLSGKNKRIMHIGTHGYYISSKSSGISKLPYSARKLFGNSEADDNLLLNNGLFMAGVNRKGDSYSNISDDGVLTALEISEMDLSGVDMVVLSACETGLGSISSDGVFGLQRGFKLADVNSIMMSLDKVDDDVTCLLMTEFYRNYLSGKSKHDAFEKAKEYVRMKFPDRNQWASFIMLDAID